MKKCKNVVAVRERERELYFSKIKNSLIRVVKNKINKKDSDISHVEIHDLCYYLFVF